MVEIRNAGTGTLSWTATPTTFDGGNWLTVSAPSGTAPAMVTVNVVTANLPNAGLVAGLFTGQVLFLSNNSSVTVPISVSVGGNTFLQTNGISFTMPQAGNNPLPQTLTAVGLGSGTGYVATYYTGNGGAWMTATPSGNCCGTPRVETVNVSAPTGMAAGRYTGELILDGTTSPQVVPVTLTVGAPNTSFFDNVQGQMSFFSNVNTTPASQSMQLRNFIGNGLPWTLATMTADAGNWLNVSVNNGTTPSTITVSIDITKLPNQGLVAGQFTGQLLFQSATSSVTVPVSVQLGTNIFAQSGILNFSMPYGGSNPLTQNLTVSGLGTSVGFTATATAGNGGDWLSISPFGNCCGTPRAITYTVNGKPGNVFVPAGVHTGQAVFNGTTAALTVPVILSVSGTPVWTISKSHTGNFTAGQNGTYTVIVSNQTGNTVDSTNGTATVTENVPAGMTLVSMSGTNWTCSSNTCTRSDTLQPGASFDPITVTVSVSASATGPLTNSVTVTGGGSVQATATDSTKIITKCDLNGDGDAGIADVQAIINQILGLSPATADLNHDGTVNILDIQIVVNAALHLGCTAQ
jgi:hypothetical protein